MSNRIQMLNACSQAASRIVRREKLAKWSEKARVLARLGDVDLDGLTKLRDGIQPDVEEVTAALRPVVALIEQHTSGRDMDEIILTAERIVMRMAEGLWNAKTLEGLIQPTSPAWAVQDARLHIKRYAELVTMAQTIFKAAREVWVLRGQAMDQTNLLKRS